MGCSGSTANTKKPNTGGKPSANAPAQPKPTTKTVALDQATLNSVLKTDAKNKTTKLNLDLQYKEAHRKFIDTVAAGKNKMAFQRFADITSVEILLSDKPNDAHNKKLIDVIKNQFPSSINRLTLKSLAKKPESLKPYIDALFYAKTQIKNEFCTKNLAIDGATFSTVLEANASTKRVVFFGSTFSGLDKVALNATTKYTTDELSFSYCKGLNDAKGNATHVIAAIGKNKNLVASLKTIELAHNKLGSEADVKKALTSANLSKVKLVFKEAAKKAAKPAKGAADSDDEADEDENSDEDEDEDEDENEASDEEEDSD
jgi:hypothetical protein